MLGLLAEAQAKITSGNNDLEIIEEYTQKIQNDPDINLFYGYIEHQRYDFHNLLTNTEKRKEFLREQNNVINKVNENFTSFVKNYPKEYIKDIIITWMEIYQEYFGKFKDVTPLIGTHDRLNILGSMFYSIHAQRDSQFVTLDRKILSLIPEILKYFHTNKKDIKEQISRL